jgi:adenine deaminase
MCDEDELFGIGNIKRLLSNPLIQAIGEITRWTDIIEGNRKIKDLISFAKRLKKRVDGHTAGAKYKQLALLSEAGIESCHEAITAKEALERLRLGMYVILRESSLRQDLKELLRIVTENRVLTDRLMLTTDCSSPAFYDDFGIMDNILKIAIDMGIDPILVYRMVTINPAVYFGMDHEIGGIAPGRFADMVILTDIKDPRPEMVISKGRIIVKNGKLIDSFPIMDWNQFFTQLSFKKNNWRLDSRMLEIKTKGKLISFPVISLVKTVITRIEWKELKVKDGFIHLPESPKYSFICLINKEGRWISKGIIKGFGNLQGFASSFNTASQILVIGRNPDAMAKAVNRVLEINGGIVAIEDGSIVYELPLPLGGIMSDRSIVELASKERELKNFLVNRGYPFHDPFYTLVFLPNDFLPEVRINYEGDCEHKNPGSFMAQMRSKYMRLSF